MLSYLPILVFTVFAAGFLAVTLLAARLLLAHDHRFSIRYYLIAVLFVVFDVETIFLFPWAVMFDRLALFGFIEMTVFLGILVIGYVYVWNRGALDWA
jgi:NADH:ubiquinone oxidoreductase subunit 3 (subunit A)